ncbi:MAG: putative DNA binding domain-containing protein [Deltaproteobacteria bacterium]|nr:putative DNA binding domain-containing protein [Deltaproteobacteria bacterium]
MNESKIQALLKQGEGLRIEFKKCQAALNKDIYETVCAFLNRSGGELLLGVDDDGTVTGIDESLIRQIKSDFTTAINNPQKISPSCYLSMEEVIIDGKAILSIYIPESSQVHRCNGKIFDRNEDGDFDITGNNTLVSELFLRKQTSYSENRIYPYVTIEDLREDVIARVRKMAGIQRPGHPWQEMDDFELVQSAQLHRKDYQTGKLGFTLAAVLLFGRDEVILSVLPHFRTDAILRRENLDRYDDRDDIRTNLIDSYDRLMAFVEKHLPDKFYLEKDQRISIRDHIFREVAGNILIHREYLSPFPAKFIIEPHRVYTENSNKPHGHGPISPANFSPFPKNPAIAKVFKEIGRADELGSGVRKLFKYGRIYSGADPQLLEEDIFKIIIPLALQDTAQDTEQDTTQDTAQDTAQAVMQDERTLKILEFCRTPRKREEIQALIGVSHREYFRKEILTPLLEQGLLHPAAPGKMTSPKQKYYSGAQQNEKGVENNSIEFDGIGKLNGGKNPEDD